MGIENYIVRIETLSPVFIGSGEVIKKSEYIQDKNNKKVYIMDTLKMFNSLRKRGLIEAYENFINQSKQANLSDFVKQKGISSNVYSEWASYSYDISSDIIGRNSEIMACTKDAYNMPYIPGSSFKGALRGTLANAVINEKREEYADIIKSVDHNITNFKKRKYYLSDESNDIDIKLYHRQRKGSDVKEGNAVNSMMRGLVVRDSKPLKTTDIVLCRKIDILPDNTYNKIDVFRECIKPGTIIELELSIDRDVFEFSIDFLEESLHIMYSNYFNNFLSKFSGIAKQTGNVMFIGGGTGFHTKTVLSSLYDDPKTIAEKTGIVLENVSAQGKGRIGKHKNDYQDPGVSPRTRKCTRYNGKLYDVGMCKIDFQPIQ